jgi:peptidyl-prolyl cis-trans isomerase SurA
MIRTVLLAMLLYIHAAWAEPLDRIVAVVNDEVILASELREMEETITQQLRQRQVALPPYDIFKSQVLERLIMQKLQLQTAARTGIRLADDALNAALREVAARNNLSLREFRDVLERDGYDFSVFRESIRRDMIISRLHKKQVGDKITVSDREVDNFLATQELQGGVEDAYYLLHILVSVPEAASPKQLQEAESKLAKIQNLLDQGADFSEVASGYSDGQNALEGGVLGWRTQGELPSLFAEVVPKMDVSEVSDVLRSGSGFHLVKLADKKSQEEHMVKQTLASHILIKTNELVTDEEAEARLNQLRERIVNGADFTELARAHSDDTVSALRGGSLGWASAGVMVPEFEEKMNALAKNEMSEVFKSRFGWHLILLEDRREQNMAEEFKRNKAREQIHTRKSNEEIDNWLRALRDEAYVEYRDL